MTIKMRRPAAVCALSTLLGALVAAAPAQAASYGGCGTYQQVDACVSYSRGYTRVTADFYIRFGELCPNRDGVARLAIMGDRTNPYDEFRQQVLATDIGVGFGHGGFHSGQIHWQLPFPWSSGAAYARVDITCGNEWYPDESPHLYFP